MKKQVWIFVWTLLVCLMLTCAAQAATVYVADNGAGDGTSANAPIGSLDKAVAALAGEGGEVVLVGDTTVRLVTTLPAQKGDLRISAQNGAKFWLNANLTFANGGSGNTITLDNMEISTNRAVFVYLFFQYNHFVIGDNVTVTSAAGKYPILCAGYFCPGMDAARQKDASLVSYDRDTRIEIRSGTWEAFLGGNYREDWYSAIGVMRGNLTLTITGGAFMGTAIRSGSEHNRSFVATAFSGMNYASGNIDVTIRGGEFHGPIYAMARVGAYYGLTAYTDYARTGEVTVRMTGGSFDGGEICAVQQSPSSAGLLRGNYTLSIGSGVMLEDGTVLSAEWVEPYAGASKIASLENNAKGKAEVRGFDRVNGKNADGKEPIRIAFIGDSITWGTGATSAELNAYPAVLQSTLDRQGMAYTVGNFGVAAAGVFSITKYYYNDTLLYHTSLEEFDPNIVVFVLGTNDAATAGGTASRMQMFHDAYKQLIEAYAALPSVTDVYVSTLFYRHSGYTSSGTAASRTANMRAVSCIIPQIKQITAELSAENTDARFTLIDIYALTLDDFLTGAIPTTDKLHPNTAGYQVVASYMYDAIFNGKCGTDAAFCKDFYLDTIYLSTYGKLTAPGTFEAPMNNMDVAFGRISRSGGRIILLDDFKIDYNLDTPCDITGTLYLGGMEGAQPKLQFTLDSFKAGGALEMDNLLFSTVGGVNIPLIVAQYHDLTLGKNLRTEAKTGGNLPFVLAGYNVYADGASAATTAAIDFPDAVCADRDVTVKLLGGGYYAYYGGNRRAVTAAPLGTYSGKLTTIVDGAHFTANFAAVGMNYLTGTSILDLRATPSACRFYGVGRVGTSSGANTFDPMRSTGRMIAILRDGEIGCELVATEEKSEQTQTIPTLLLTDGASTVSRSGFSKTARLFGGDSLKTLLTFLK